jgi:hypothetical protein
MPPFRPNNLNKRLYPGNANVIGPTTCPSCTTSNTTCCSSTPSCGACVETTLSLGCRCTCCHCPCCCICCSCTETLCTRTTPSGMYKTSEQYCSRTLDRWGPSSCSCGAATCLCCTNVGFACTTIANDYKGFFICCGPSTTKWFVAPSCTQVNRDWYSSGDAVTTANSLMGSCGWFVPNCSQLQNPGYSCRTYWDSYSSTGYWSSTERAYPHNTSGWAVNFSNGSTFSNYKDTIYCVRAFRCTPT